MTVLTINSGSTSIKLAAYDVIARNKPVCRRSEHHDGEADPTRVLRAFIQKLDSPPQSVAHRVVHGGSFFTSAIRIDESVIAAIEQLSELAPLHNPKALKWIAAAREVCSPGVAQVAHFDTAFFAGLPRVAAEYALPPRIGVDRGVRRYGFHGLAHQSMWHRWCELHSELPRGGRLITLQLGGGCSIAAIDNGRPVDTSMGFSPLEGLVMATRSGDVDPAIIPYLQRQMAMTGEQVVEMLNRQSGLAGVSGIGSNPQDLLNQDSPQARFAIELYCYRARKYVGAYLAVLGGCDGIAFGGGVGEHVPEVREGILKNMGWAGIELDSAANAAARGGDARISRDGKSGPVERVKVYAIAVDEDVPLVNAALALQPNRWQ